MPNSLVTSLRLIGVMLIAGSLLSCTETQETQNSQENPLVIQQTEAESWPLNGRTYAGHRFSPLNQINQSNIDRLGLAWHFDVPRDGGQESTPLVVNGVIYFSGSWGSVYALDAKSGMLLWSYDPQVDRSRLVKACCGPVNRGVAFWENKVYVGAFDGRLIALDASNGELIWSTQTIDDPDSNYTITGAPLVASGKVYIGNGGSEFGARGYVGAYDANTGQKIWRFYTVPGNPADGFENDAMAMAAKTWFGEWWKMGGGGTAYDALAYDPELNLFYIGVGNAGPYNPEVRTEGKGDNLFVSSIVAVNADSGEYVWHYQTTPGDAWDFTATQNMILSELEINGKQRKVIMQAPKNGFFYVLDRETGEFISAEAFDLVTWASGFDENGRPIIKESAKYWLRDEPTLVFPSALGAHNWHPMSYSPKTGYVYIPANHMPTSYIIEENFEPLPIGHNTGIDYSFSDFPADPAALKEMRKYLYGRLVAWDPIAQKEVWSIKQNKPMNGGVLSTEGNLVFQGTTEGQLIAYNASTGNPLWQYEAQTFVSAAPISYAIDGEQYIAVLVGRGGSLHIMGGDAYDKELIQRSRLLVFKLDATAQLPANDEVRLTLPDWSEITLDDQKVAAGSKTYAHFCFFCHGAAAVGSGVFPDLRYSAFIINQQAFDQVVLGGILKDKGMVSFSSVITPEQSDELRQYIIHRNQLSRKFGDTSRAGR